MFEEHQKKSELASSLEAIHNIEHLAQAYPQEFEIISEALNQGTIQWSDMINKDLLSHNDIPKEELFSILINPTGPFNLSKLLLEAYSLPLENQQIAPELNQRIKDFSDEFIQLIRQALLFSKQINTDYLKEQITKIAKKIKEEKVKELMEPARQQISYYEKSGRIPYS